MTLYYLDASAWVKAYYQEPGTFWVRDLLEVSPWIACSCLGVVEVVSTLTRKRKAGQIQAEQLVESLKVLKLHWRTFVRVSTNVALSEAALEVAVQHALRGADAVHLASALHLIGRIRGVDEKPTMVTSDLELARAARDSGLVVIDPVEEEGRPGRVDASPTRE